MSDNREIDNKITKIMGSYLLKGYTLLDTHCPNCQTPLMKTKASDDYCIFCNEVNIKSVPKNSSNGSTVRPTAEDIKVEDKTQDKSQTRIQNNSNCDSNSDEFNKDINRTVAVVHEKISWATDRLKSCDQFTDCIQIINFLKSSADLIQTLKQLSQK